MGRKALKLLVFAVLISSLLSAAGKKTLGIYDSLKWKRISGATLSEDGRWFGYALVPNLGKAEVVIKDLKTGKEYKFNIGEVKGYLMKTVSFSADSRWAAFFSYPEKKKVKRKLP